MNAFHCCFSFCLILLVNIKKSSTCFPGGGIPNMYGNPYPNNGYPYNGYPYGPGYGSPQPNQITGNGTANQNPAAPPPPNYMYPTTGIAGAFDNLGNAVFRAGFAQSEACRTLLNGKKMTTILTFTCT